MAGVWKLRHSKWHRITAANEGEWSAQWLVSSWSPSSFRGYKPKTDLGAPGVEVIDNPGMWNLYLFEPRYGVVKEKGKKGMDGKKQKAICEYQGHFTPA